MASFRPYKSSPPSSPPPPPLPPARKVERWRKGVTNPSGRDAGTSIGCMIIRLSHGS